MRRGRSPLAAITKRFVAEYGLTVRAGPFAGLRYPSAIASRVHFLVPKLLGIYEQEIHEPLERALEVRPAHVLNVGCSDGYYAAGAALRLPEARVTALDPMPEERRLCAGLAAENEVEDRVGIEGEAATLPDVSGAVLLVDCESCEEELLDPARSPSLETATILVELHDRFRPGLSERLLPRFERSHALSIYESEPRWYGQVPEIDELAETAAEAELAVSELRPEPMRWAFLEPRERP